MKTKKRILLNWWYDRADLLAPFRAVQQEAVIFLIFYKRPSQEKSKPPFPVLYWDDFSSPYELLDKVKPDEVVFVNIDDGPYQVALNIACRQRKISTAICDHGLRGFAEVPVQKFKFSDDKHKTLRFLFSSLSFSSLHLLPKLCLLTYYKLTHSDLGRTGLQLRELRLPSRYICYTSASADYFAERDGTDVATAVIVGNPSLDSFFSPVDNTLSPGDFYLLIDQPFVGGYFGNDLLTLEEKNNFLLKLTEFCLLQGKKLVVKLHPENYGQKQFLQHSDVRYIEEETINSYLHSCCGVFGFYSSLLVSAIYFKPCYVFRIKELPIQTLWAELGVVKMLDFYTFTPADIRFDEFVKNADGLRKFVELFIYKPDGESSDRLKQALLK